MGGIGKEGGYDEGFEPRDYYEGIVDTREVFIILVQNNDLIKAQ